MNKPFLNWLVKLDTIMTVKLLQTRSLKHHIVQTHKHVYHELLVPSVFLGWGYMPLSYGTFTNINPSNWAMTLMMIDLVQLVHCIRFFWQT